MKLLLTSGGIMNKSIEKAFLEMTGKKPSDTRVAFVPTAANVEDGDKRWLAEDLESLVKMGIGTVDIVDISALPKDIWKKRLVKADVLEFGGGNTFHLLYWIKKSGLGKILKDLLKNRLYVGISAGSIVTNPDLLLSTSEPFDPQFYSKEIGKISDRKGLGFVDFYVRPHMNSKYFPDITHEKVRSLAEKIKAPVYLIDDETAIAVKNGKISIISEAKYHIYNK